LGELDKWYSKLLPIIRPYMHVVSGGPVIAVQVENEYGSFDACDFAYMSYLRDIHSRLLGKDVLLFTTDGGTDERFLMCGKTDNVLATVDFGPDDNARRAFAIQRAHQQFGPAVNSEFYTGWIDHWEEPHSVADAPKVCSALDAILKLNASVNL
jgi:beta-galactosidase